MKQEIYNSELFWMNHPSPYVTMYMKYDWFQMDRIEFMHYYTNELLVSKLEEKKDAIRGVLSPIWFDMPSSEKYIVLTKLGIKKHYCDIFQNLLVLNDMLECDFLKSTINKIYNFSTGMNYNTNFLICYGINSPK